MKLPLYEPVAIGAPFILIPEIATAILRTVEAGWVHARQFPDVNPNTAEVPITERLRKGMRQALDDEEFSWSNADMRVLPGTESFSHPDLLVPDGRTDIPIVICSFRGHDPHAIIECKRIAGNDAHLCREYVKEGIDRFKNGKYAGNHSTGFMIGYLIASNALAAVTGINKHLNRTSRNGENLQPSQLINELWAWGSCHPRTETFKIELHHAFLSLNS